MNEIMFRLLSYSQQRIVFEGSWLWYRDHVLFVFDVPVPMHKDKVQGFPARLMTQGVRGVREL
jgi:hypothetical protein